MTVEDRSLSQQRDPAAGITTVTGPGLPAGESPARRQSLPSGPGAKARILVTANRLFYYEGIRAVGIDRLISESSVTKATFYKHFGAKDTLIIAYITQVHDETVNLINSIEAESESPLETLRSITDYLHLQLQNADFRGCAFINAAVEFADPEHPVRQLVMAHRDWYTAVLAELFRAAGHPLPGDAADEFLVMRDGAMIGAYVGDNIAAGAAVRRLADHIIQVLAA